MNNDFFFFLIRELIIWSFFFRFANGASIVKSVNVFTKNRNVVPKIPVIDHRLNFSICLTVMVLYAKL